MLRKLFIKAEYDLADVYGWSTLIFSLLRNLSLASVIISKQYFEYLLLPPYLSLMDLHSTFLRVLTFSLKLPKFYEHLFWLPLNLDWIKLRKIDVLSVDTCFYTFLVSFLFLNVWYIYKDFIMSQETILLDTDPVLVHL